MGVVFSYLLEVLGEPETLTAFSDGGQKGSLEVGEGVVLGKANHVEAGVRCRQVVSSSARADLELRREAGKAAAGELRASGGELQQLGDLLLGEVVQREPEPRDRSQRSPENDRVEPLEVVELVVADAADQKLELVLVEQGQQVVGYEEVEPLEELLQRLLDAA